MSLPNLLSLHERLCLVRTLTGFPHPITFLLTYPAASALPTRAALVARLEELLRCWAHLRARVHGADTNAPRWAWGEGKEWTAEEVVRDANVSVTEGVSTEKILHEEMVDFGRTQLVLNEEPSMRVTRYLPDETDGQSRTKEAYLAVTINHLVTDGVGAARIMQALLSDDFARDYEPGHPPRLEDTIDLIPPELALSTSTTSTTHAPRPWPGTGVSGAPIDYPEGLSLLTLPPELIARVIAAGKARGVSKLHPILKAAWAVAMHTALDSAATSDLTLTSPRSERRPAVHPYATGNYISRVVLRFTPTELAPIHTSPSPDPLWSLAREIAADLSDPAQQEAGRHTMGRMAYVLNRPNSPKERTAWEEHYLALARSGAPYGNSATLSNLTYVPLPREATGLCWAQPACPYSVPLMVSLIGSQAGVSWTTTWREGCVVSREDVKRVERAFVSVLERVSAAIDPV